MSAVSRSFFGGGGGGGGGAGGGAKLRFQQLWQVTLVARGIGGDTV